jgi:hypothetical protein
VAFIIPRFILPANIYRVGVPVTDPPSLVVMGNLSWGRRSTGTTGIPDDLSPDTMFGNILFPAGTDVRDNYSVPGADIIEFPAGSKRYYGVKQVDDVAKGFANEFRFAVIYKLAPWPSPIP